VSGGRRRREIIHLSKFGAGCNRNSFKLKNVLLHWNILIFDLNIFTNRAKADHYERRIKRSTGPVLESIQQLAAEEHRLYEHEALTDADRARLASINVKLDQCWDLLRQRQALRDAGRNPSESRVRPGEIVENYEQ
jgi:hypothetical protein